MIRRLNKDEALPWELLLLADPEKEKVLKYVSGGSILVEEIAGEICGVLVYQKHDQGWEIMNVAVAPVHQRQGIAQCLLAACFADLREKGIEKVIVKTGDIPSGPLQLYQQNGFQVETIIPNYFVENYFEPIFEAGQQLKNQVILKRSL